MDIGTAKPSLAEQHRVPHHLLGVVDPDESYSLAQYQADALAAQAVVGGGGVGLDPPECEILNDPNFAPGC